MEPVASVDQQDEQDEPVSMQVNTHETCICITIYNVQKWGFPSYSHLSDDFQRRFHFRAYVQLISNIRRSILRYINNNTQWTFEYKDYLKLQIYLYLFSIILAIIGTFSLPYLYSKNLIGWTLIVFGITFCGIGLCICAIFWYHLQSKALINCYKHMISHDINQGLNKLNILYSNKAKFEIDKINSSLSIFNFAIDLNLTFKITLLTKDNIEKQSYQKKPLKSTKRKYISEDIFNRSTSVSRASISSVYSSYGRMIGLKLSRFESSKTETDKVVLLKMVNGDTVVAQIDNNNNHKGVNIPIIVENQDDTDIDNDKQDNDNSNDNDNDNDINQSKLEMYTEFKLDEDDDDVMQLQREKQSDDEKTERENKRKLELFQSDKVYQDIVKLVDIHNDDECDKQYNYYNIGLEIAKYLDDLMDDKECVIVVSERNKQPQLSYVAQKGFQRKIKNISGKDIFIYLGLKYISLNTENQQYLTKDFKQIVLNLSQIYGSTPDIASELDNIYGGGCHVAIGKYTNYNIFCRYSHDLIARVHTNNEIFVIAWRR